MDVRKPSWLKTRIGGDKRFEATQRIVNDARLHTICVAGKCPNRSECWSCGTATFLIAGDVCTRSCRFCNTQTGRPLPLDAGEPERVAQSIRQMELRHAVITSVDRDDLPDLGARHWADTLRAVRLANPLIAIEALIPDFGGNAQLIDMVIDAGPDIVGHNMETVRRLTPSVRSAARYDTSLLVIKHASRRVVAKTGIMVGLGETNDEVLELMDDVRTAGASILTIGQYLRPSRAAIPVAAYIEPERFEEWKTIGLGKGFTRVESGALVRSSYRAGG
jgi:lipoic acid synthetase